MKTVTEQVHLATVSMTLMVCWQKYTELSPLPHGYTSEKPELEQHTSLASYYIMATYGLMRDKGGHTHTCTA